MPNGISAISKKDPARLSTQLLAWYDRNARVLPWRYTAGQTPDPYRVWLSEVMLQQTSVATVKDYFRRFTDKWPRVQDLAAADSQEVMHAWQGLGYYARARNLHRCAQTVVREYGGQFPPKVEDLLKLPGIGTYTAGAVSAIAFNRRAVAVDGNVERVFARVLALKTPLPTLKKTIAATVEPFVPLERPGDYTQALMDLGATLCSPKKPNCLICPLQNLCRGFAEGNAGTLPLRLPKKARPVRETLFYWIEDSAGNVLIERRPEKGLLGGMNGWPGSRWIKSGQEERGQDGPAQERPDQEEQDPATEFDLEREKAVLERCGSGAVIAPAPIEHLFTHFKLKGWVGKCFIQDKAGTPAALFDPDQAERLSWWPKDRLDELALPACMKKVARAATGQTA